MSPPDLAKGTLVGGDFRIVETLARGGMGVVYIAEQESTRKRRALKVMLPQDGDLDFLRKRFEQEAHVSGQIESDHVVEVIGAGVDAVTTMPWIAMELMEGEDLEAALTARGAFDWTDTWNIIGELCHALDAAHRLGLIHRDLKPSNVFLARSRRPGVDRVVKILDFGIAKRMSDASKTTGALGTPLYMAPEQTTAGSTFSPATDVWALGLLVFEMLVGVPYWKSANSETGQIAMLLREVILDPLAPATERAAFLGHPERLPAHFDGWFAQCVVRDPKQRFRDAGHAYRSLAIVFSHVTGLSPRAIPPASARVPVAAAPIAISPVLPGFDETAVTEVVEARSADRLREETRTQPAFERGADANAPRRSRASVLIAGIAFGVAIVAVAVFVRVVQRPQVETHASATVEPVVFSPAAPSSGSDGSDPTVKPSPSALAPLMVAPFPSNSAAIAPAHAGSSGSPVHSPSASSRAAPRAAPPPVASPPVAPPVATPPVAPPPRPPPAPSPSRPDPVIL